MQSPLRIKVIIDARNLPILHFRGGIGRSDEPMTRVAWESVIANFDPSQVHEFKIAWKRWKFNGATWDGKDLPLKIKQSTI